MNKIIKLVILVAIFNTLMYARITKDEVDNIMNKSNAGLLFHNIKRSMQIKAYLTFLVYEDFPEEGKSYGLGVR